MLRIFVFLVVAVAAGSASAKCRYNNDVLTNCENAMSDWWNDNAAHQSQSSEDINHRTKGLKGTLQECIDCAMDKVESGAGQATQSTDSDTRTNTSN
jgi:hypothetical protein